MRAILIESRSKVDGDSCMFDENKGVPVGIFGISGGSRCISNRKRHVADGNRLVFERKKGITNGERGITNSKRGIFDGDRGILVGNIRCPEFPTQTSSKNYLPKLYCGFAAALV